MVANVVIGQSVLLRGPTAESTASHPASGAPRGPDSVKPLTTVTVGRGSEIPK